MYRFLASEEFWSTFYKDLPPDKKEKVREKWQKFKENPFDPSLGTHKIHKLSARFRTTVYAVEIEGNLRVLFLIKEDNLIYTIGIGTHDIYK